MRLQRSRGKHYVGQSLCTTTADGLDRLSELHAVEFIGNNPEHVRRLGCAPELGSSSSTVHNSFTWFPTLIQTVLRTIVGVANEVAGRIDI